MQLSKVRISNFRSIKYAEVYFSRHNCRILVGINESGKSNILRALSLLSPNIEPEDSDKREPLPEEGKLSEHYVAFDFILSKVDLNTIYEKVVLSTILSEKSKPILRQRGKKLTLKEFCNSRNEGIFRIDLQAKRKYAQYFALPAPGSYEITPSWKRPVKNCPNAINVPVAGVEYPLNKLKLIDTDAIDGDFDFKYLEDVTPEYVTGVIGQEITSFIPQHLPEVVYWKYDDALILEPRVDIDKFSLSPDACVLLKNMFELSGQVNATTSVFEAFSEAKGRSPRQGIQNLLNKVANETTKHFQKTWKNYKLDFRDVSFHLRENGNSVDISIKDHFNHYELSRRSDGFKRFIAFLLYISSQVRTKKLRNALLLFDEPDTSLHPSGSRHLRDELLRIAESNFVAYATHSIYMIDRDIITRHLIVRKKDEITHVEDAHESNYADEEVLFNALGTSMFESLNEKNILFEGWTDKILFKTVLEKSPKIDKATKKYFSRIGLAHSPGVKRLGNITPTLELANRKCLILTDADSPAKEEQIEHKNKNGYGIWKRYDELIRDLPIVTSEDFLKSSAYFKALKESIPNYDALKPFEEGRLSDSAGKIAVTKTWLRNNGIKNQDERNLLEKIKLNLFSNLKHSDVEDYYVQLFPLLKQELANL